MGAAVFSGDRYWAISEVNLSPLRTAAPTLSNLP
jgi:hypothetical protein